MKKHIIYGSKKIEYTLQYSPRKTLGITVTPEMDVIVKAPVNAPINKIEHLVHKRAPWIIKQRYFFLTFFPKQLPRRYVSGETHYYLGRQYRLKVIVSRNESVKLTGRYIIVNGKDKSRAGALLKRWYAQRAKEKIHDYVESLLIHFTKHEIAPSEIAIRAMPKRWGSCAPNGKIIFNTDLIKAPRGCVEYVIIHELCHLVHPNHTPQFIALQSKIMPDWQKWKMKLENLLA